MESKSVIISLFEESLPRSPSCTSFGWGPSATWLQPKWGWIEWCKCSKGIGTRIHTWDHVWWNRFPCFFCFLLLQTRDYCSHVAWCEFSCCPPGSEASNRLTLQLLRPSALEPPGIDTVHISLGQFAPWQIQRGCELILLVLAMDISIYIYIWDTLRYNMSISIFGSNGISEDLQQFPFKGFLGRFRSMILTYV